MGRDEIQTGPKKITRDQAGKFSKSLVWAAPTGEREARIAEHHSSRLGSQLARRVADFYLGLVVAVGRRDIGDHSHLLTSFQALSTTLGQSSSWTSFCSRLRANSTKP